MNPNVASPTRTRSSRYGAFCATIDTYATYNRNTVHGYPDGEANHILNTWVEGGCVWLLHGSRDFTRQV